MFLSIYDELMDKGISMQEIDEMDIFYYLDILIYRLKRLDRQSRKQKNKKVYIDQIPGFF
ncbi:hypothetical protein CLPU_34c00020 [Gottschalkia purinilytica]|uniref:Uncharacterized protein n=1 Tax=Gottschalkia purinilytica TaxID=1503 RepID=A0A0L0W659_GOTPU|nr:hypothetical protein CLPU_34c00020 [Gottschalkia purinilytica]